jgi:hypothetical protein
MLLSIQLYGQNEIKSTGIGFRFSYYDGGPHTVSFERVGYAEFNAESSGGAGATFFVFSRFSKRLSIEFSVGGLARFMADHKWYMEEDVEVFAAVPLLAGLRVDLLPATSQIMIKPYVGGGLGTYILSDIHITHEHGVEKGTIETNLSSGGYGAAGLNIHFSPSIALNFEAKYHMVNFDADHNRSGVEVGMGIVFFWGTYTPTSRNIALNIMD